jgi:hypothetical protein
MSANLHRLPDADEAVISGSDFTNGFHAAVDCGRRSQDEWLRHDPGGVVREVRISGACCCRSRAPGGGRTGCLRQTKPSCRGPAGV